MNDIKGLDQHEEPPEMKVVRLPAANASASLLGIIERAARDPSINFDKLEKLLTMAERMEAKGARKAFDEAIAIAKSKIPPIVKNRTGHNTKYADFAAIARVVDPILGESGLSYRFRTSQGEKLISVTCILSHKSGHSEEITLSGPADTSGAKNAIQSIGSTLTYLQRYSLIQALGLAAAEDDDGNASGLGAMISDEQLAHLEATLAEVGGNYAAFCKLLRVESLEKLPVRQYDSAVALLANKRKAKEAQS